MEGWWGATEGVAGRPVRVVCLLRAMVSSSPAMASPPRYTLAGGEVYDSHHISALALNFGPSLRRVLIPAAQPQGELALLRGHRVRVPRRGEDDVDDGILHARDGRERALDRSLQLGPVRAEGGREGHRQLDVVALRLRVDVDAVDEAQVDNPQVQLGIFDGLQRLHDLLFSDGHGGAPLVPARRRSRRAPRTSRGREIFARRRVIPGHPDPRPGR